MFIVDKMCSKMSDERMIRYLLEDKEGKNIVVKNMKKGLSITNGIKS